jgi:hypothetical protein
MGLGRAGGASRQEGRNRLGRCTRPKAVNCSRPKAVNCRRGLAGSTVVGVYVNKNFGRSLRSRLSSVGSGRLWFFFEENRNRNGGVVIVSVLMGWMRELRVGAGAKGWWGYLILMG